MKLLTMFLLKIFKQLYYSIRAAHYVAITLSILLFIIFDKFSTRDLGIEYLGILNTIGILSTFFIFALEKIDFNELIRKYSKKVPAGKVFGKNNLTSQGDQITNTFFSFVIVDVLLLGIQYILYLMNIMLPILLFFSINYMVIGFIMIIGTWHGSEIHKL